VRHNAGRGRARAASRRAGVRGRRPSRGDRRRCFPPGVPDLRALGRGAHRGGGPQHPGAPRPPGRRRQPPARVHPGERAPAPGALRGRPHLAAAPGSRPGRGGAGVGGEDVPRGDGGRGRRRAGAAPGRARHPALAALHPGRPGALRAGGDQGIPHLRRRRGGRRAARRPLGRHADRRCAGDGEPAPVGRAGGAQRDQPHPGQFSNAGAGL
ncbi:MAG: hypothetical protein AVDCRST_MAG68-4846, partial [uncultured Gemmatimonadetes bacterium]